MNCSKLGSSGFTCGSLLDHLVQRVEGVADALSLLGTDRRGCSRHLVQVGLHHLFTQSFDELLEALPRLARGKAVAR